MRALLLVALLLAAPARAEAPDATPAPAPRPASTQPDALALLAEAELSGDTAWILIDLADGAALDGGAADAPLPLASVAKIATALYALDALGPDHRFETRLVALGPVEAGVLKGDLALQGGGDPETDSADLALLAARAVEAGLRQVEGRLLVDAALYPSVFEIDPEQPEIAAYNPSVGALNLNFNRVFAEWERRGGAVAIKVEARADGASPPTEAVRVEVRDAPAGPAAFSRIGGEAPEVWQAATVALARPGGRWLPVRRPDLYSGEVFRRLAAAEGLALPPAEPGEAPFVAEVLARIESRPLADILGEMLRHSTNLTAEAAGLAAARAGGGSIDSLAASAEAMNLWAAGFAGFPPGDPGFRLLNHSGLSGESRASARRIAELLVAADRRGFPALDGGRAANLKGLLPDRPYLDRGAAPPAREASVRAKTGTLDFVSALAGYIETDGGPRFAFAILSADLAARAAVAGAEIETAPGARAWAARARALQRALIRSWIDRYGG